MHNQDTFTGPSFSMKNRLARLIWNLTWAFLFWPSPSVFHGWRNFILRCFGAKIGRGVHVYPKVKIWAPWNLVLKDECGIANGVNLYSQDFITVGKRAVISQHSFICTGTHDYTKKGHPLITAPINIEDKSWVAAEAFLHPGVTIGEGAVIGARSVVTRDMPSWMVCAGHPCVPIKKREYVE
jgi:putative colanic acid biosynthesis acetyltransferase WcaF